jgi:hypothetical protein
MTSTKLLSGSSYLFDKTPHPKNTVRSRTLDVSHLAGDGGETPGDAWRRPVTRGET